MFLSVCSSGFAIADEGDDEVGETEKRKLSCGTLKEQHKAKNLKTAGKLFLQHRTNCSIVN